MKLSNLGHCLKLTKLFKLLKFRHVVYHFESEYIVCFEIFKYRENMSNNRFCKTQKIFLCLCSMNLIFFELSKMA